MADSSELDKFLKNKVRAWASKLTTSIKSKAPAHIAPHIYSKSSLADGKYSISIGVKRVETTKNGAISNYGTLDAKAWEYGSGIHRGKHIVNAQWKKIFKLTGSSDIANYYAGKYSIRPVKKKYLAFHWDVIDKTNEDEVISGISSFSDAVNDEPKKFPTLPDGRALLTRVAHPGVKARPYMRPAVIQWRKDMDKLAPELKKIISTDLRRGLSINLKGKVIKVES